MKNLKDTISNYAAVILVIAGGVQTFLTLNASKPIDFGQLSLYLVGIIIAYLTGKNPDGSTKSDGQVTTQNSQSTPK